MEGQGVLRGSDPVGSDWRPGGSEAPRQSVCPVGREGPRQSRGSRCLRAGAAMGHCDHLLPLLSGRHALALQPVSPEHAHPPVGVGGPEGSQHPCLSAPPSLIHALTRRCPQPTSVTGRIPGILPGLGWEDVPPWRRLLPRAGLGGMPPKRGLLPRAGLGSPPWPRAPVPLRLAPCSKCLLSITCACRLCRPGGILHLQVLVSGCFLGAARPSVGTLGITGLGGTMPTRVELGFPSMCTTGPTATRESGILCLCLIHTCVRTHTHADIHTHTLTHTH